MIFDSHAHYDFPKFGTVINCLVYKDGDFQVEQLSRAQLFERLRAEGICAVVDPGVDIESNRRLIKLAEEFPGWIYPAVGIHPTRTYKKKRDIRREIEQLSELPSVVAIGEAGLDFHLKRKDQHRSWQRRWFRFQLRLAKKRGLPVVFHIRQADRAAIRMMKHRCRGLKGGVVHCFCGDAATAKQYVDMGLYLGIGGALLQPSERSGALCEAVKATPIEWLLVETDAPYVHPYCDVLSNRRSRQRTRNTSLVLPAVIARIAELKGMSAEDVENITRENAKKLFGISC